MMIMPLLSLVWLLTVAPSLIADEPQAQGSTDKPKIENFQLMVKGAPFLIKGMAYSPEPKGYPGNDLEGSSPYNWDYNKGAWMCMPANQYGTTDWQSPCSDDDFFGFLTIQSDANNKFNAVLKDKWDRELQEMKNIGVNTLRLYNINPAQIESKFSKDHRAFLDVVHAKGMYVLYPILTDYLSHAEQYDKNKIIQAIKEVCGHEAILAFTAGNELPEDSGTRARVNETVQLIHDTCPGSLVTYAMADDPSKWALNDQGISLLLAGPGKIPDVDFITVNAGYRGDPNNPSNAYPDLFTKVKALTEKYNKPFLIGEVGKHLNDNYSPNWFNSFWKMVLQKSKEAHNLGAIYFSFNDEPIKKSVSGTSNDIKMGIVEAGTPRPDTKDSVEDPPSVRKPDFEMFNGQGCNYKACDDVPQS